MRSNIMISMAFVVFSFISSPFEVFGETIVSTTHWRETDGGNGHYYQLVLPDADTTITWYEAQARLEERGGYLATVTSKAEDEFLKIQFQSLLDTPVGRFNSYWAWIGLTDVVQEGRFEWVTGEPFSYTNWVVGEPNNLFNEDFMHYKVRGEFTNDLRWGWNDASLAASFLQEFNGRFGYIGEFDVVPVPEPSSAMLVICSFAFIVTCLHAKRRTKQNAALNQTYF